MESNSPSLLGGWVGTPESGLHPALPAGVIPYSLYPNETHTLDFASLYPVAVNCIHVQNTDIIHKCTLCGRPIYNGDCLTICMCCAHLEHLIPTHKVSTMPITEGKFCSACDGRTRVDSLQRSVNSYTNMRKQAIMWQ